MANVDWMDPVLRGLCYWAGYRTELYPHHKLTEGAIVDELALLLRAHLEPGKSIVREQPYSTFSSRKSQLAEDHLRSRADLVLGPLEPKKKKSKRRRFVSPEIVMEVKRGGAYGVVKKDLVKMASCQGEDSTWRGWSLIVFQNCARTGKLRDWTTVNENARRTIFEKESGNIPYRVRRVCKTTSTKSEKKRHWAVLLELV